MFSSKPQDIANFRAVTNSPKPGISIAYTFKCKRCKDIHNVSERRRVSKYPRDGFICVHCKDELASKAKLAKTALAED